MENRLLRAFQAAVFATLPMLGAFLGGLLDERHHQGFTTWRSACRATGLSLATLVDFTWQLLPGALIGLLLGGLVILAAGAALRERHARLCVAAHAGCAVTLPVALILCAFLPPWLMLAADAVLGTLAAGMLLWLLRRPSRAADAHP